MKKSGPEKPMPARPENAPWPGVFRLTRDGAVLSLDAAAMELCDLGDLFRDSTAASGHNIRELVTGFIEGMERSEAEGAGKGQWRLRTLRGRDKWVEAYICPDTDGPEHALVVARDITPQKRLEELLRLQSDLSAALSGAHDSRTAITLTLDSLLYLEEADCAIAFSVRDGAYSAVAHRGFPPDFTRRFAQLGPAAAAGSPLVTDRPLFADAADLFPDTLPEGLRAACVIPVFSGGQPAAVFCAASRTVSAFGAEARNAFLVLTEQLNGVFERIADDESLRIEEERLRGLLSSLHDTLIVVFDGEGRFISVSGPLELESRCGIQTLDLAGRLFSDFLDDGAAAAWREQMAWVFRSGYPMRQEYKVRFPGGVFWLEAAISPMRSPDGAARTLAGFLRDVTGQRKIYEQLRESEWRYRRITEALSDYIFTVRLENGAPVETIHGLACETVTGYTSEEFNQNSMLWIQMVPESDRERVHGQAAAILTRGEFEIIEHRIIHKDGSTRWVRNTPVGIYDEDGVLTGWEGVVRDITKRRQAEEAQEQALSLLRTVMDHLPDYAFVKDTQCRFVLGNAAHLETLGVSSIEDAAGKTDFDFFPEEKARHFQEDDRAVIETGRPVLNRAETITDREGVERSLLTTRVPLTDARGRVTGLVGISRDITERKALEEKMQEARKLESLGVLAGGIAHDFNNLLMSITGNADLAFTHCGGNDKLRNHLKMIEQAATRAADLCAKMLAYSGQGRYVVEAIDISRTAQEMTHLLGISISHNADLQFRLGESLPAVRGDVAQLRQVLLNLIANASEAIGNEPGRITVTTGVKQCDADFLKGLLPGGEHEPGRYVFLEVADTGCGMDDETLPRIFEPFYTTKFTGRGLGLAAVLGIVRGHGGAMHVRSEVGRGTVFTLYFPALAEPAAAADTPSREPEDWRGSGVILLADDEEAIRMVGRRMLGKAGFDVLAAAGGEEAVTLFRQHADAVVCAILDLKMPDKDGLETFRELRGMNPDIPVIISSGFSEVEVIDRCGEMPPDGFLQKPYQYVKMLSKVRDVLLGRR
jgi:PAS domain S-box-containing protein